MSVNVDSLSVQIDDNSAQAVKGLNGIGAALATIRSAARGGAGLNSIAKSLERINVAINGTADAPSTLKQISDSIKALDGVKISSTIKTNLSDIGKSIGSFSADANYEGVNQVAESLRKLDGVKVSKTLGDSLTNITNALNEIGEVKPVNPQLVANLDQLGTGMQSFAGLDRIQFAGIAKLVTSLGALGKIKPISNVIFTNIDKLAAALHRLNNATSNIGTARLNALAKAAHALSPAMSKAAKSTGLFGNSATGTIAKLGVITYAIKRVGGVLKGWIDQSNAFVENVNLFTVSMGEYADEAMRYAEKVQDVMGIDMSEWIRNQGMFMQLATGFGVVEDKAYSMSKTLTQLGYDLSSYFNAPVEEAMTKLQSGIAGEIEPLRRWGMALSQAKLEEIALSLGIEQKVANMTEADKGMLRYIAIMQQSTNALGDMARTIMTPANAMRILDGQIKQLTRALGNLFIPILIEVIPYVIAFVRVLTTAIQALATLFGFELPTIDYSGLEDAGGAVGDLEDGLGGASDKAKELKGLLAGFDQINLIQSQSGGGASGAGGGSSVDWDAIEDFDLSKFEYDFLGDLQSQIDDIIKEFERWLPLIKTIAAALAGLWLVDKILDFIGALSKVATAIGKGGLLGGIDAVKAALAGFVAAFAIAATGAYAMVMNGVDPFLAAAIAAVGSFALVGPILASVIGPAGWAVAAIGAVAGAITGVILAQEQLRKEFVGTFLFDNGGTPIEAYVEQVRMLGETLDAQRNREIVRMGVEIVGKKEEIDNSIIAIESFMNTIGINTPVMQEDIDKLKGMFDDLYNTINEKLTLSSQIINTALVGALSRASGETATHIEGLIGSYNLFASETQGSLAELKKQLDESIQGLKGLSRGTPEFEAQSKEIADLTKRMGELSGSVTDSQTKFNLMKSDLKDTPIDFGDLENAKKRIGEMETIGKELLDGIEQAKVVSITEIDNAIAAATAAGNLEDVEMLGDIKQILIDDFANQKSGIQTELSEIFGEVRSAYESQLNQALDASSPTWKDHLGALGLSYYSGAEYDRAVEAMSYQAVHTAYSGIDDAFRQAEGTLDVSFMENEGAYMAERLGQGFYDILASGDQIALLEFFMERVGGAVSGAFTGIKTDIETLWGGVADWFETEVTKPISDFFTGIWDDIVGVWNGAVEWFSGVANGIWEVVRVPIALILTLFDSIWNGIKSTWDTVSTWFDTNVIKPVSKFFSDLWSDIKGVWDEVSGWFDTTVIKPVVGFFKDLWTDVSGFFESLWEDVEGVWDTVSTWFDTTVIQPVKTAFDSAISDISGFFTDLWADVEKVWKDVATWFNEKVATPIGDFFKGAINTVIRAINGIVNGINSIKIDYPDWVADLLGMARGSSFGFNIRTIPELASGGFVDAGQLFIARERGPELVAQMGNRTAVANNEQIVAGITGGVERANREQVLLQRETNKLLRQLVASIGNGGGRITDVEAGRALIRIMNAAEMASGTY